MKLSWEINFFEGLEILLLNKFLAVTRARKAERIVAAQESTMIFKYQDMLSFFILVKEATVECLLLCYVKWLWSDDASTILSIEYHAKFHLTEASRHLDFCGQRIKDWLPVLFVQPQWLE